jgi:hypothetical protein
MTPRKLTGLIPQAYEHPSDAAALNVLQHTVGLDILVRKLSEWGFERIVRVQLTGSYLQVNGDAFPDLDWILTIACERLDLPVRPDLYISPGPMNAFTMGVTRPLIVVSSGAVERLTPEELLFVIAHEVGHVKSGHVFYYQIAEYLPVIGQAWLSEMGESHPWTVARAHELLTWVDAKGYEAVLESPGRIAGAAAAAGCRCDRCHHALAGSETFCPKCGLALARAAGR